MKDITSRADELLEVIIAIAKRDFRTKATVTGDGSDADALAAGINMLGEELEHSSISLHEKEVLLKEVHHRVKNNLQIVSSLLNLQSSFIEDEDVQKRLQESQDRIKSMALIHEMIYQSNDLSSIEMGGYLRELASYLLRSYTVDIEVSCHVNIIPPSVRFDVDRAIPIGLIVNELVTNCLKYAFKEEDESPELQISLVLEEEEYTLQIADNGKGMSGDVSDPDTLGLSLVHALVDQLNGTVESNSDNGLSVSVRFKA